MAEPISLYDLGRYGVVTDKNPLLMPPESWSACNNVRFTENGVETIFGFAQVMGTPSVVPEFVMHVPATAGSLWLYFSLTQAFAYESATHVEVTRLSSNYNATAGREWGGTIFGGIPIINNFEDIPQYWPTLSSAVELDDLPNWPATLRARRIVGFGPYAVALHLLDDTTLLESSLQWSHKADPGSVPSSWDITDPTVDAGRTHLTDAEGGALLDGVPLGNRLVLYKENSTHLMRFVGGQDIMGFDLLLERSGILAARCACSYNNGTRHFVVTANGVITHAGTKEVQPIADEKIRREIFDNIDQENFPNSFCFEDDANDEIVFAYPTSGNEYPNRAAVYNYGKSENNWSFKDWRGESVSQGNLSDTTEIIWNDATIPWDEFEGTWQSEARYQLIASSRSETKLYVLNTGYEFDGLATQSFIERTALAIDGINRDKTPRASQTSQKQIKRLWPVAEGDVTMTVRVGSQDVSGGPVTYEPSVVFDPATDKYVDRVAVGTYLAIRYEVPLGNPWTLSAHHLEISRISKI